ncbi:MAG: OmpA family protein [Bacteroidota bacterium]
MKKTLQLAFVFFGFLQTLWAQGNFTPERFTNRPLTLFNDATSVGWNPALLGIGTHTDLVLALPYTRNFAYDNQVGGFYSQDGVGFGLISDRSAQLTSPYIPFSFYWGLGFNVIEDNTWLGGSFRYSEFGTSSIRFNGSFIHKPINPLLISGGISNMHSLNADNLTYNFSLAYSITQWLQLLGTYTLTSDTLLFGGEQKSAQIGVSASTLNRSLVTSFMVNPVLREARFGIEMAFGGISLGLLNDASTLNSPGGRFTGGNMLLRYQSDYHEHEDIVEPDDPCTTIACRYPGCPGRKCTRAGQYSYRCIRENCPGIACNACTDGDCSLHITININCQPRCLICFHPIIFNWNVNINIKNTCIFCSCTHYSHYYYFINYPVKYVHIHDTVKVIEKVIEYVQDCSKCHHDCSTCPHDCSKCTHKCPPCPDCPPTPCEKDTVYITNTIVKDTCIQKPPILPPSIIIEGCEFPYNECYPYDECMPKIQDLIQFMLSHPDTCIIMTAHTDSIGTDADNLKLSQCRAEAMKQLLENAGIDGDRIIPIGKGEPEPIDTNSTPEGRRRNRRVQYIFFSCSKDVFEDDYRWEEEP